MTTYSIQSPTFGHLGFYKADSEEEALDVFARNEGYGRFSDALKKNGNNPLLSELIVRPT